MREINIREGTIRLGQFLKLADLVAAGGDVKALLADGSVRVNGENETRRGRQIKRGDVVSVGKTVVKVG
jgi:ribosome-associated protein